MRQSSFTLLLPLSILAACSGAGADKGADDSGSADGGNDGGIVYEEGCILVDGAGGYAWINDAIAVADEGSTIELCPETAHEEAVVVVKGVHIVGPGSDQFTLVAPTNSTGLEITAAGASVSGISVTTTRSAISLEGADDASLSDIAISEAGNWAIRSADSDGVSISNATLLSNGADGINYGGVLIEGGSATITDSTVQGNVGFGVWADAGAAVTLRGNDISGTVEFPDDPDQTDGIGVFASAGAEVTSEGNTYISNALAAGWTDSGDLSMSGDEMTGGAVGAYVFNGAATFSDVIVQEVTALGLLAAGESPVRISGATVTTTPEGSASTAYDGFPSESIAGAGILVSAMDIEIDNVAVSGFNNAGIFIEGRDTGAVGSIHTATLSNNGRYGVYVNNGITATFTDVDIADTRIVDDAAARLVDLDGDGTAETDPLCYYVNYWAGVLNALSTVSWTGGSITGSEGWGVSSLRGSFTADDVDFEGAACAGTISYEAVLSVSNSNFTNRGGAPHVLSQDDAAVLMTGNTFTANQWEGEYVDTVDYSAYGYRYTYTYAPGFAANYDARIFGAASLEISDNTFETGGLGLYLAGVDGTVERNSWTDYRSSAVTVASYTSSDGSTNRGDVVIEDATFDQVNGRMLYCSNANLELDGVEVSNGGTYTYSYDYLQEYDSTGDGVLDASYGFTSTSSASNIGLYGYGCNLTLSDVSMESLEGNGVEVVATSTPTSVEAIGLSIASVGTVSTSSEAGLRVYASQGEVLLNLTDVVIDDVATLPGVSVYTTGDGVVDLTADNLTVGNTGDDGVYLRGYGATAQLTNLLVSNAGGNGVESVSASVDIVGTSITDSVGVGFLASGDFDGDGYTIQGGDCDDTTSLVSPGRTEVVGDQLDNDCDGVVDDGTDTADNDGDGVSIADGDCNDRLYSGEDVYPGATENPQNGMDDDCDGVVDDGIGPAIRLSGLSISGSGASGVQLSDLAATSTDSAFTGNGGWGMECDNVTFTTCDTTTLTGNTSGGHTGCDETCGL